MRWLLPIVGLALVIAGVLSALGDDEAETAPGTPAPVAQRRAPRAQPASQRAAQDPVLSSVDPVAERKARIVAEQRDDENRFVRSGQVDSTSSARGQDVAPAPAAAPAEVAAGDVEKAAAPSEEDGEPMYPSTEDEPPPRRPTPQMVELLTEARAAAEGGNKEKALARLKEAEDIAPEPRLEEQMRVMRLNVLYDSGRWDEVRTLAEQIRKDPIRGATLTLVRDLLAKMQRQHGGSTYKKSEYDEQADK